MDLVDQPSGMGRGRAYGPRPRPGNSRVLLRDVGADHAEADEIHRPAGRSTVIRDLRADHVYRVEESEGLKTLQTAVK
jgi:hypothetical protein